MARPIQTVPHKRSSSGATETYEFSCTIGNISRFRSNNMMIGHVVAYGFAMQSVPTFFTRPDKLTPGDKKPVEFVVRFVPGDFVSEKFQFIFLVVSHKRPTSSLEIVFTQSVVKANGEKHTLASKKKMSDCPFEITSISRDELYNPVNRFVTNNSITLHYEVIIRDKPGLGDQLQHVNSQLEPLAQSFGDLLQSGAHSDVIFVLVDDGGEELRAHKNILAARSQMFADMFAFCPADSSHDPIEIVKTRVAVFKQALNFIYTDKVGGPLDGTAQDLLICADKCQLDSLKSICEDYLVSSITGESDLLELHELAERINAPKLQAKVEDLVRNDVGGLLSKMSQMKRQLTSLEAAAAADPKTKKSKSSN